MKRKLQTTVIVLMGVVGLSLSAATARAGVDIDFGATIQTGNDSDLFLHVSSRYFDREPQVVDRWEGRFGDPDDCGVAFFLASHSGAPIERVYELRRHGLSWWQIGLRLRVPVDVWFVAAPEPMPPYGRAYGYWHRYQRDPRYRFTLSDREARDLVALRVLHDYYGMSPREAMMRREHGGNLRTLVAREYRERHVAGHTGQDRRSALDRGRKTDRRDRGGRDERGNSDRGRRGR
jgi:hypothetical protein